MSGLEVAWNIMKGEIGITRERGLGKILPRGFGVDGYSPGVMKPEPSRLGGYSFVFGRLARISSLARVRWFSHARTAAARSEFINPSIMAICSSMEA